MAQSSSPNGQYTSNIRGMNMAQVHPNVAFQQPSQIQQGNQSAFVIVNETPSQRHNFPLSFKEKQVLAVSILKIIIGVFQLGVGIANFFFMFVFTTVVAFPIWCGILFIVNGIVGVVIKCRKSKCTIAAFFGLSIVSLFFTSVMLICYSLALYIIDYNGNRRWWRYTCDYYPRYYCRYTWYRRYSSWFVETSLGLHGFLMALIVMELACSIAAVVYSCKAYSKCCNTCGVNDCCTCVGCCECSMESLLHQELRQSAPQYQMHQFQQQQQHQQQQLFIQPSQTNQIFQQQQPGNAQQCSNPCSGLIKIILNWGGASKPLASIQHNPENPHCIQVNLNSEGHPSDNAAIFDETSEAMAGPLVRFNQSAHEQDLPPRANDKAAFQRE